MLKVTNIMSQEAALSRAEFDPNFPAVFGSIKFEINGVKFLASTVDRWADNLFVNTDTIVPLVPYNVRNEVCNFFQSIWDKKEVENIRIPDLILRQLSYHTT